MKDYKYIVEISMKDKELKGKLQEIKSNYNIINYNFVPTSVLCDLSIFKYETNTDDKDITFIGYEYENAFNESIKINKHKDIYYYSFVELIKERIINNKPISLKELDKIKLFFDIELDYSISYIEEVKENKFKNKKAKFDYIPLQYGFCNISKVFENNKNKAHKYIYHCSNLTDVIFAILHYLTINNYSYVRKCNHCGKLYFYNHRSQIYCKRNSPYEKYTHLDCEQAVRNIKKKLSDRNKSIKVHLDNYYYHNLNRYLDNWYKLKDEVDKCSSVENLKRLEEFTSKENMRKNYYIDE